MSSIDPALLALAGLGVSDAPTLPRQGWSDCIDDVFAHGLAGLLAEAYEFDLVDLDEATCDRLRAQLEAEAIRAVQLEGELIRLETPLADLGAVVLKGAVLAHGAYANPAVRPFTDLDVLVAGDRHAEATRALEVYGYRRSRPEPAPGYDANIGKALTLVHPGGVVIDLHRTLAPGLAGASIEVDDILGGRCHVAVNDRAVPAPSWNAHFVEVCLHAVVGDGLGRALSLRDVAQVLAHPELDVGRALELSRRWKVTPIVATALRATVDAFGIALPNQLQHLADKHGRNRPSASASTRSSRSRLAELRGGSIRRRLAVARSLVLPSSEFLRFTYGDGHSTPDLYVRRWRALFRRSLDARGGVSSTTPLMRLPSVLDPGATGAPGVEHRGPTAATTTVARLRSAPDRQPLVVPGRVRGPTISLPRAQIGIATVAVAGGARAQSLSAAVLPPLPSRQERWAEARPPAAHVVGTRATPRRSGDAPPPLPPAPVGDDRVEETAPSPLPGIATNSGVSMCVGGIFVLLAASCLARVGVDWGGVVLVPLAAILFAMALWRRLERTRPDEAWVGRWMVVGVVAKVVASYFRYTTLVSSYKGVGDASDYDTWGRQFAQFWMGHGPNPYLPDLRKTNFIRWFTGVVYYVFGSNLIAGFFVFGLLALVGSYLWYRATADSVPFLDRRWYLALVLFAPSLAFWPSSIGKESLMQLALGIMALATALFLKQRLIVGLLVGLPGGWLLWVVRPHLLAMTVIAATFAYVVGRVRSAKGTSAVGTRTIGLIVIAFIMAFSLGQMMKFLGMKDLSLNSIDQTLNQQQARTAQGGSSFDNGGDYLSPVNLPRGFATVLLRPFPWEVESPFQLLASAESAAFAIILVVRFKSVRASLTRARGTPYLLYCWVFTFLFAASFASFANFGLLVRERSLVLPAFFVLLSLRTPDGETTAGANRPVRTSVRTEPA